jgi:glycosyltransferase involved in cell wall biosynthesis
MNILQVTPYFAPAWAYGGPVRVCYEVCTELARRGHKVTVYTTDSIGAHGRVNQKKVEASLSTLSVRYFKNLNNWLAFTHHLFFTPGMLLEGKKRIQDFDIIHMAEYRTFQNVITYRYALRYHIPYILQGHGSIPRRMTKQRLKNIYDVLWGFKLLRNACKVIALTPTEVEQCKNMGIPSNKIEIVPNGVNLDEYSDLPPKGDFKNKYFLNSNDRMILYLGRIHAIKGIDMLIRAFTKLPKQINNVKLVIAGPDDGYFFTLKQLIHDLKIEKSIILPGPLYGRSKLEAYVDAEMCITPSQSEGFPIGVLESWACRTPVIVTEGCGITDIVDGKAGLVVPYDDNKMAEAITVLLSDQQMRTSLGERGKLLINERFNWTTIVDQLELIYKSCMITK